MVASPPTCSSSSRTRGHGAAEPSTPRPARTTTSRAPSTARPRLAGHRHARASIACDHSSRSADAVALAACLHRRRRRGSRGARGAVLAVGAAGLTSRPCCCSRRWASSASSCASLTVTSRIGFSFLSIILLASGAILGPFGAWCVGLVSVVIDRDAKVRWFQRVFNAAMTAVVGVAGGWAYALSRGSEDLASLSGLTDIATELGLPLLIADVVQCITNALLLSGVIHLYQGVPFLVFLRRVLVSSGVAYVGYGAIGFLFVILWFPAQLGPFSAVLILAPLLAARWAFIQFGDELRSHERTVDTLVTALATKDPGCGGAEPARRPARRVGRRGDGARSQPDRHGALCGDAARDRAPRGADAAAATATALAQRRRATGRRPPLRARGADDRGHRLPRARAFGHPPPRGALRRPRHP